MSKLSQAELIALILDKLDDLKAEEPVTIDVTSKSSITDNIIIVTGNSNRHVRSLADYLIVEMKKLGVECLGEEGQNTGEWVVVDFGTVMVHIMQDEHRKEYALEKLWV